MVEDERVKMEIEEKKKKKLYEAMKEQFKLKEEMRF